MLIKYKEVTLKDSEDEILLSLKELESLSNENTERI